jgi:hypothetical protein
MPEDWAEALAGEAPDLTAPYAAYRDGRLLEVRSDVRRRAGDGAALRLAPQHAAVARVFGDLLARADDALLDAPGGEGDWTLAEALGHAIESRQGLVLAAQLAATGRFPADSPPVVKGIAGPSGATREELRTRLDRSQRFLERAIPRVEGHERTECPLIHPDLGQLRCGEWLIVAGVHDLLHVAQLHSLVER